MRARPLLLAVFALSGTLCGCGAAYDPASNPGGADRPQAADTNVIAAALGYFAGRTEGLLRVEPRPLRADASLQGIGPRDIDETDAELTGARRTLLDRRRIPATDAVADMRCAFSRGVPPPDSLLRLEPDSIRSRRQACLARGIYTTYAFGRAQPVGTPESPRAVRVRAYRITTWSYEVWDLDLRPTRRGFAVVAARRLGGVAS